MKEKQLKERESKLKEREKHLEQQFKVVVREYLGIQHILSPSPFLRS